MFLLALLTLMNIAVDTAAAIQVDAETIRIENELVGPNQAIDDQHLTIFNNFMVTMNLETSFIINREKHDKIVTYLKGSTEKPDAKFKYYVKKGQFNLVIEDDKEVL